MYSPNSSKVGLTNISRVTPNAPRSPNKSRMLAPLNQTGAQGSPASTLLNKQMEALNIEG